MKRKLISIALVAGIALTMLSGCGERSASGLKKVTVWSGNSHSKTVVSKLVDEFNKTRGKELGVQIEYTVKTGDAEKGVELAFETGDEPDFCSSGSTQNLAEQGKLVAINDLPGGEEFLSGFDKETYDNFTFDGKTYKAPYGATTIGLIYNKDMFKAAGIVDENGEAKPPKTLDEVREYAKKLTNKKKQEYGFIVPLKTDWVWGVEISNIGKASANFRDYDWKTGKYDYSADKPVMEMYKAMQDDGSIFPGINNMDNDAARAQFAQGKIGMKFGASYDVAVFNTQFPAQCDWGVAPIPTVNENERYKVGCTTGGFLMITKKAVEHLGEETAFEIYKWFHDDDMMTKLYEEGMEIPCKPELIKNAKVTSKLKGWKEFADLVDISYTESWKTPGTIRTGEPSTTDYFLNEFWTGKMTAEQVVDTLNKSFAAGLEKWYEQNPNEKREDYVVPDYNTKLDA